MKLFDRRSFILGATAGATFASGFSSVASASAADHFIAIWNPHTSEKLYAPFFVRGKWIKETLKSVAWILRDHHSDVAHAIDPKLIVLLSQLQRRSATSYYLEVTSGFRTRHTNVQVEGAPNSYHLRGMAADINLRDISVSKLAGLAKGMQLGGCGEYDKWLHVDSGPVRKW